MRHTYIIPNVLLGIDGPLASQTEKRTKPYADLGQVTWNEGTPYAVSLPTLNMLDVPKRQRMRGVGTTLVQRVLEWMRKHKIPYLAFDNFADDFWSVLETRMPANVVLSPNRRQGILRTDANVNADGILWNLPAASRRKR